MPPPTITTVEDIQTRAAKGELHGLFRGVPEDAYHTSGVGLSQSLLKAMARSPRHFREAVDQPRSPTPDMIRGTALHCRVLDGEAAYAARYAPPPVGERRTKAGKAAYGDQIAALATKVILPRDMFDEVDRMARALEGAPLARSVLASPDREVTAYWTMEGVLCRARLDVVLAGDVVVDLKTTANASPEAFKRSAWNYRYDWQLAWYGIGYERIVGRPVSASLWIVVESEPPHGVAVYRCPEEELALARSEVLAAFRSYRACAAADQWPCYPEAIQDLSLPITWAR